MNDDFRSDPGIPRDLVIGFALKVLAMIAVSGLLAWYFMA